jgi:hypothetical protein
LISSASSASRNAASAAASGPEQTSFASGWRTLRPATVRAERASEVTRSTASMRASSAGSMRASSTAGRSVRKIESAPSLCSATYSSSAENGAIGANRYAATVRPRCNVS